MTKKFAIARTYGNGAISPALNIVNGWLAWETFCEAAKENRPITVRDLDCTMSLHCDNCSTGYEMKFS